MTRAPLLFRPMTVAAVAILTVGAIGLGTLGSDGWIASGYAGRQAADVWGPDFYSPGALKPVAADEAYWLKAGRSDMTPAVAHFPQRLSFGPLDVVSVSPLPASIRIAAEALHPMVLVTVRETTAHGPRLVRFIVEAGHAPTASPPAAKGL